MPDKEFTGKVVSVDVTTAGSGVEQFTGELRVKDRGVVNIENTGGSSLGMIGTVTLEYRSDYAETWIELDTIDVAATTMGRFEFSGYGDRHRVGIDRQNISSGTATLRLKG